MIHYKRSELKDMDDKVWTFLNIYGKWPNAYSVFFCARPASADVTFSLMETRTHCILNMYQNDNREEFSDEVIKLKFL